MKDHIKKDSFYAISRLVFEHNESGISRKEISERCSFSQMTVGKVVSLLAKKELVDQSPAARSKGRHAQLITPSDRIRYLTVTVSDNAYSFLCADFRGSILSRGGGMINPSMSYKDNFQTIIYNAMRMSTSPEQTVIAYLVRDFTPTEDTSRLTLHRSCIHLSSAERTELVKRRVKDQFRRYNTVYVGFFDNVCTLMMLEKSKLILCQTFEITTYDTHRTCDTIIGYIKEAAAAHALLPDTLILECGASPRISEDIVYTGIREALLSMGCTVKRCEKYKNMLFTDTSALLELKKKTAQILTDRFYDNNK